MILMSPTSEYFDPNLGQIFMFPLSCFGSVFIIKRLFIVQSERIR